MNAFSRSWMITKLSFSVINKDRELIGFALLSFIFSSLFTVAMVLPTIVPTLLNEGFNTDVLEIYHYAIMFVTYFGLAFIATFFNVCVVYTTKTRFEGGNATFGQSFGFAFSRLGLIVKWSLLAASVGLLLRILDNLASRLGKIGQIVASILIGMLGLAWSIITIFVVPVLVYEGLGPIDAVKRSTEVLKKTWGESLIRAIGLGFVQFVVFLGIIAFSVALGYVLMTAFDLVGLFVAIGIGVLLLFFTGLIFSVATTIFNTALYVYANQGNVVEGFSDEIVKGAFRRK